MSLTGASTRPDRNEARADRRAGRSRRGAGGARSAGGIARMGRATRRRDRERQARVRDSLRGARNALRRLGESRATYRDLALRVEAALLRTVPRRDLGGLEGCLAHALRAAGFEMPEASDGWLRTAEKFAIAVGAVRRRLRCAPCATFPNDVRRHIEASL